MINEIRRERIPESLRWDAPEPPTIAMELPELSELPMPTPTPVPRRTRRYLVPIITTTAVSVVGLGVSVGLPMINSIHRVDTYTIPPESNGTNEPSPSLPPVLPPILPPPQPPVEQTPLPSKTSRTIFPIPLSAQSVCETQEGTVEGQLPSGAFILPGTSDRPSIFVVSPDRSADQSFTVRPAGNSDTDWQTVSEEDDVGIVGIATSDTRFRTTDGDAVWAKSCEPTSLDAVEEVESRVHDLCSRTELGLRAIVVYDVGVDGKPVEMKSTDCS